MAARKKSVSGKSISSISSEIGEREVGLQPTVFYRWQKEFFENGAAAFEQKGGRSHQAEQERIEYLKKKIQTKDEVLAELIDHRRSRIGLLIRG
jgi:transposase